MGDRPRAASHDALSSERTCERGVRGRGLRRLVRLVVLTVLTLVGAGIVSPGLAVASAAASIERTARPARTTAAVRLRRASSALPATHKWREGAARPEAGDADGAADLDSCIDDGDTRSDVSRDAALALGRDAFPREGGRPSRHDPQVDTLRFVAGRGLPRAPPASLAAAR